MKKTFLVLMMFAFVTYNSQAEAQILGKIGKVLETVNKVLGSDEEAAAPATTVSSQTATYDTSGPFKGVWNMKSENAEGRMNLDLYSKSIVGMDAIGDEVKCYGTISVTFVYGASIRVDECVITESQPKGNKATIKFTGGRDGNTYQATLTYNPANKKITVSDTTRLGEEEFGECYVSDGLVFSK